jgi:hypothetical protein
MAKFKIGDKVIIKGLSEEEFKILLDIKNWDIDYYSYRTDVVRFYAGREGIIKEKSTYRGYIVYRLNYFDNEIDDDTGFFPEELKKIR